MDWAALFVYDESSPSCIRWAVDIRTGRKYARVLVAKGAVAGSIGGCGYWQVTYAGKCYKVHRIIWELCGNVLLPKEDIDHINGNSVDNRICNLRSATRSLNMQNRRKGSNNTSGVVGVHLTPVKNGSGVHKLYACATWNEGVKKRKKSFAVDVFGLIPAFTLACKHREEVIKQLNAKGANYSERHGK